MTQSNMTVSKLQSEAVKGKLEILGMTPEIDKLLTKNYKLKEKYLKKLSIQSKGK